MGKRITSLIVIIAVLITLIPTIVFADNILDIIVVMPNGNEYVESGLFYSETATESFYVKVSDRNNCIVDSITLLNNKSNKV